MRPGIRRINFYEVTNNRLEGLRPFGTEPIEPKLMERKMVREPRADLFQVADRSRGPFTLRDCLCYGSVRVERERLRSENFTPKPQCFGSISAKIGEVCRGPQPRGFGRSLHCTAHLGKRRNRATDDPPHPAARMKEADGAAPVH